MNVLEIQHLSKQFGTHQVLRDLTFQVPEHSVYGFLGQNGAGKTTTMKIILGLLKADKGEVKVLGETVRYGFAKTNRRVGYLPDVPEFYGYMKAEQYLRLCGEITGLSAKEICSRSEELLSLVGLSEEKKKIRGYSRGMKQRLGIAQALLNEPGLLICDEPTSALDPLGRKEILDILSKVREKTTVLFSTHVLSDVERICDRAAVLKDGSLALSGSLEELKEQHRKDSLCLETGTPGGQKLLESEFQKKGYVFGVEKKNGVLIFHTSDMARLETELMICMTEHNICPLKMEVQKPTLENLFMEVIS
ncbi:ABC transporter ATP-binding protein [Anaerostipes sp.]|uniref:ABC transporter ATP-binding protein n=1 Tax=unclassified Anaerostipes TaxID=2635253 RepID=UPI00257F9F0A|nr:ABC transporter ATP-binding protein [Anaerostipes sp.]MBS4929127.1 ABC transporter ATP-binding protein [Anaerostipes sp.]WRY49175.1 ABC transporter ATP-binding protein [Anaerostipes sp. PC18]